MEIRNRNEKGMRQNRKDAFPSFRSHHRSSLLALDGKHSLSFPSVAPIISTLTFFAHFSDYRKRAIPVISTISIWRFHHKSANLVQEACTFIKRL